MENKHMIFLLQLNQQMNVPEEINFGALFLRMLIFLGLVVLLIFFLLRKVLPAMVPGARYGTKTVRILERVPIDQKKSLLIVEIQDRVYLIGSGEGQINVLMELDKEKITVPEPTAPKPVSFSEVLKKTFSRSKP